MIADRATIVIGPERRVRLINTMPKEIARNIPETIRAIESVLLTCKHVVATPVNW
jgi:alkyl hydroperoxide reductase subunit AhpC